MLCALISSSCKGEDEGEGPYKARDYFRARFKILRPHTAPLTLRESDCVWSFKRGALGGRNGSQIFKKWSEMVLSCLALHKNDSRETFFRGIIRF